jgi:hypothetical protein
MDCHSLSVWVIGISALGAVDCGGRSVLDSSEPLTGASVNGVGGASHASASTAANTATGGDAMQDSATIGTAPVTGGSANTGGTDAMTGGTSATTDCAPPASSLTNESLIDDMENGSGSILDTDGRLGVWYAFDIEGSVQWPAPTTPGVPIETSAIPSGRCASQRAMHTYGAAGDTGARWAGIGFDLNFDGTTYGTYSASAYDGITFWAHGTPNTIEARISTIATTSTLYGGTCTMDDPPVGEGCQPHHRTVYLGDDFGQYWIPFDPLTPAFSVPFEKDRLTNVQFYVDYRNTLGSFDFWIDDVSFYRGNPSCCASSPAECGGIIQFSSSDLKARIGEGSLSCADVCYLQTLHFSSYTAPASAKSLRGLQCLISLKALTISNYAVSDIGVLAGL